MCSTFYILLDTSPRWFSKQGGPQHFFTSARLQITSYAQDTRFSWHLAIAQQWQAGALGIVDVDISTGNADIFACLAAAVLGALAGTFRNATQMIRGVLAPVKEEVGTTIIGARAKVRNDAALVSSVVACERGSAASGQYTECLPNCEGDGKLLHFQSLIIRVEACASKVWGLSQARLGDYLHPVGSSVQQHWGVSTWAGSFSCHVPAMKPLLCGA